MISFKGAHVVKDFILTCVRWYVPYPLRTRHVAELTRERAGPCGPRDEHPMARQVQPAIRSSVLPPQAPGRAPLADG
jgi:hypothetical protein